jgi:hypothetical protein
MKSKNFKVNQAASKKAVKNLFEEMQNRAAWTIYLLKKDKPAYYDLAAHLASITAHSETLKEMNQ